MPAPENRFAGRFTGYRLVTSGCGFGAVYGAIIALSSVLDGKAACVLQCVIRRA